MGAGDELRVKPEPGSNDHLYYFPMTFPDLSLGLCLPDSASVGQRNDRQIYRPGPSRGHRQLLGASGQLKSSELQNCTALTLNSDCMHAFEHGTTLLSAPTLVNEGDAPHFTWCLEIQTIWYSV